jgi:hypothetical protein
LRLEHLDTFVVTFNPQKGICAQLAHKK